MTCLADLHTHSTASDGQYSPAELAALARRAGVECLALTDHDTLDGLPEGREAAQRLGMTFVPGVELGAKEARYLHILGLGFDTAPSPLSRLCRLLKEGRDQRKYRILDFLAEKGLHISLEEVEAVAGGQIIARPHFARVMVRRGFVSTPREAFDRYLDTEEFQKIERFKATAEECIRAIHAAGGKAVLAHPYQLGLSDEALTQTLAWLKELGLDGLECRYPRHSPEQTAFYLRLAETFRLHVTAGSDFHGEMVKPDIQITPSVVELDWLLGEGVSRQAGRLVGKSPANRKAWSGIHNN